MFDTLVDGGDVQYNYYNPSWIKNEGRIEMKRAVSLLLAATLTLSLLAGCSSAQTDKTQADTTQAEQPVTQGSQEEGTYTAGTYTAVASGRNGDVKVEVEFSADAIKSVTITEHQESAGIADPALERIPEEIVEKQSLGIDVITGATITSQAILSAVEDCVMQAGGDVEALKAVVSDQEREKVELTTDVVVVGAGIAGMAASISAAEEGADVILLEKLSVTGGNASVAAGGFAVVGTEYEEQAGAVDTVDDAVERWMNFDNGIVDKPTQYPDEARLRFVIERMAENIDWMTAHGVKYSQVMPFTTNLNRLMADSEGYATGGAQVADKLRKSVDAAGVATYTDTRGTELIMENGTVVGVKAEGKNADYIIHANNVILTTGGFSGNPELLARFVPEYSDAQGLGVGGDTGDGIVMALEAGADVYEQQWVMAAMISTGRNFAAVNPKAGTLSYMETAIVTSQGELLLSGSNAVSSVEASMAQRNAVAEDNYKAAMSEGLEYLIYDSSNSEKTDILESGIEIGEVVKAETLEELAKALDMDPAILTATVDAYNEGKEEGAILTAPYYGVKVYPFVMGTMGGVKTDLDAHVLDQDGNIIPGLYAAGETANRPFYKYTYMNAASLSSYSIMGRIAGQNAAH